MIKLTLIQGDCLKILPKMPDGDVAISLLTGYKIKLEKLKGKKDE